MHIKNAYQTTTLLVNAYQKFISNYYLSCKCQSTMNLTCNHQYCQPFSTCFPPAIFTQPDTTVGIPVGFCLGLRSSSVCVFCVAFIHVVKTKWGCNFWYKQWRDWLFVKKWGQEKTLQYPSTTITPNHAWFFCHCLRWSWLGAKSQAFELLTSLQICKEHENWDWSYRVGTPIQPPLA